MKLKLTYATKEEIPAGYEALFTESGGQWLLTGVEGMKTQADIDAVQTGLTKERTEHKATKDKLAAFRDHDPDKLAEDLAELDDLRGLKEAGALGGKDAENKIAEAVERGVARKLAPVQRQLDKALADLATVTKERDGLTGQIKGRTIADHVRAAATEMKVLPEALEDALLYAERMFEIDDSGKVVAKDGVGLTPGIDPKTWLSDMQEKRPHWWPNSQGGGAKGGNGSAGMAKNPWSKDHWSVTEQGKYFNQHGQAKSEKMAEAAGTTFGGGRPT